MIAAIDPGTADWIRRVLAGEWPLETPEQRDERQSRPETPTARFIRESLGEASPIIPPKVRAKALLVLLEQEHKRRVALKQQAQKQK